MSSPAKSGVSTPPPGLILGQALLAALAERLALEWFGSTPHLILLNFPRPSGLGARPKQLRPADAIRSRKEQRPIHVR